MTVDLIARLKEASEWLADDIPAGTVAPQRLEGDVKLDQLDLYCVELMREVIATLTKPTAEDLLGRLDLKGQDDKSRLVVMAQNPAGNYHWTLAVGRFTAGEVRGALAKTGGAS